MEWLNYHHLFYFWTVARAGSIARASRELHLSQPTISSQLKLLERSLGHELFERQGRKRVLTDVGRTVLRYAEDIFRTGREMQQALRGAPVGDRPRLVAGVADVIPKRVAARLLQAAVDALPDLTLVCREAPLSELLATLALHELDVVLSDAPAPEEIKVKAYSHLLVECGVAFLAPAALRGLRKGFPGSLDGAPLLLPAPGTSLRRALDRWFRETGIRPRVAGEFDDSALLEAFGGRGMGAFAAPAVIAEETAAAQGLTLIGSVEEVRERFHAISVERRLRHPAVAAIAEGSRALGRRA